MTKYMMILAVLLLMVACGDDTNKTPVDNEPVQDDTTVNDDATVTDDTVDNEVPDDFVDEDTTIDDAVTDEVSDIASDEILADDPATDETGDEDAVVADCQTEGEVRWMSCGFNGNGTLKQKCSGGQWVDDGSCDDPDGCAADAEDQQPCGLNGNGTQTRSCELGESWQWSSWTVCDDPDECKNGSEGHPVDQEPDCGLNDRGKLVHVCTSGQWVVKTPEECDDPDECVNLTCMQSGPTHSWCCLNGNYVERPTQGCDVPCY